MTLNLGILTLPQLNSHHFQKDLGWLIASWISLEFETHGIGEHWLEFGQGLGKGDKARMFVFILYHVFFCLSFVFAFCVFVSSFCVFVSSFCVWVEMHWRWVGRKRGRGSWVGPPAPATPFRGRSLAIKPAQVWRAGIAQSWTPISHIAPGGGQETHPQPDLPPQRAHIAQADTSEQAGPIKMGITIGFPAQNKPIHIQHFRYWTNCTNMSKGVNLSVSFQT